MSLALRFVVCSTFTSQCLVSSAFRTYAARTNSQQFPSSSHKEITYIRHGESVGNAGVWGAISKGSPTAYRDGTLTVEGKKQVADRVELMDEALVDRILGAEVVMSSPLRRAMGTTILLLGHAKHRKLRSLGASAGDCGIDSVQFLSGDRWPLIEVVAELREKVKTHSETPGAGDDGDPMIYVRRTARKVGERLFCDEHAMDAVVQDILASYQKERERTTHDGVPWQKHHEDVPLPEDGLTFVRMIHAFKRQVLGKRSESRVVLVGHSGWSRFAFAPFMPNKGPPANETLAHGALMIRPLENAGTMRLQFYTKTAEFGFDPAYRPDAEGILPGSEELPNFEKKYKEVMLSDFSEAVAGSALPQDAALAELIMLSKIGDWTGTQRKRIFMLSSSKSLQKAYLSWFDKWGTPRGFAEISGGRTICKADAKSKQIELMMVDGEGEHKESAIQFTSTKQFEGFKRKLEKHLSMFATASVCVQSDAQ